MRKLILISGLLFVCAIPAKAAPAFVQIQGTLCNGGFASFTCAFPGNTTAGNTGIIAFNCNAPCAPSITDTQSKTWTQVVACTPPDGSTIYFFEADSLNSAADTLTVTVGSFVGKGFVAEYSGLAASAFDVSACTSGSGATANSGNTAVTAQASELIIDFFNCASVCTVSDSTTSRATGSSSGFYIFSDKNVAATGVQAATATLSFDSWNATVATFKASGGAASGGGGFGGKAGIGGKAGFGYWHRRMVDEN